MKTTYTESGWMHVGPNKEQRYEFAAYEDGRTVLTTYPEFRKESEHAG